VLTAYAKRTYGQVPARSTCTGTTTRVLKSVLGFEQKVAKYAADSTR
jgi:hypothetical protein